MARDIFISYAHRDNFLAQTIAGALEKVGLSCFLASKSIRTSQPFKQVIRENLRDCKAFFLLLSTHSLKSEWVKTEIGAAWALDKRIYPILHECSSEDLPSILSGIQARPIDELENIIEEFKKSFKQEERRRRRSLATQSYPSSRDSERRCFIGIDIGKGTIDYSLLDDSCFPGYVCYPDDREALLTDSVHAPPRFSEVYRKLSQIIRRILERASDYQVSRIHGIGVGLPGLVNPMTGTLVHSPSFNKRNERFVQRLAQSIDWEDPLIRDKLPRGMPTIPIEIDNDVRCATRWRWMRYSPNTHSLICVFIGNGLGSGIVLNGKMHYGRHFFAGEAGHTTIASPQFKEPLTKCHCRRKGHHWEMHVCNYGFLHRLRTENETEFERFKRETLRGRELSTYLVRDAFYNGDSYVAKIVAELFEHIAIGVANYISVLNPEEIVLGGGMIRGFHSRDQRSPAFSCSTHELLLDKIEEYLMPPLEGDYLTIDCTPKQELASLGAALIFKDESYFEYKRRQTL